MILIDSYALIATPEQMESSKSLNSSDVAFKTKRQIMHNGIDLDAGNYSADIMDTCSTVLFEE